MAHTARSAFTNSREVILPIFGGALGFYFGESDYVGTPYATAKEAMEKHHNDDVTRFLRFDIDMLQSIDVTEDMAKAYLDELTIRRPDLCPDDEDILSTFVRTSEAWEQFCEDYRIENGLNFRLQYSTLNHAQQGI